MQIQGFQEFFQGLLRILFRRVHLKLNLKFLRQLLSKFHREFLLHKILQSFLEFPLGAFGVFLTRLVNDFLKSSSDASPEIQKSILPEISPKKYLIFHLQILKKFFRNIFGEIAECIPEKISGKIPDNIARNREVSLEQTPMTLLGTFQTVEVGGIYKRTTERNSEENPGEVSRKVPGRFFLFF